jgi:AcrR family transcriptional regulator
VPCWRSSRPSSTPHLTTGFAGGQRLAGERKRPGLASIGYHYGSTQALLNAAVFQAMEDFGAEIGQVMSADGGLTGPVPERFERFWAHVIDSFRANAGVWAATFDVASVAQRDPQVRAAVAQGFEDGRALWASAVYGLEGHGDDQPVARAVGSPHQALLSGLLIQWLIDPDRAPSAADLTAALQAITRQLGTDQRAERDQAD